MRTRFLRRRGLATFAVLIAVAEVAGRALTGHVDRALNVQPLARPDSSYYPFLLVGVKVAGALTLAARPGPGGRAGGGRPPRRGRPPPLRSPGPRAGGGGGPARAPPPRAPRGAPGGAGRR